MWLGAITAAVALAGVGYAIIGLGRKLPLKPLLIGGASVLLLLSVAFVGNAVRSLQSAALLGATPVAHPRLPVFARRAHRHPPDAGGPDRAGACCSRSTSSGALWVFAWQPARRRRMEAAAA